MLEDLVRLFEWKFGLVSVFSYLLECSDLARGLLHVVHIQTTIVDQLALGTTVSDLRYADVAAVLVLEEHDGGPVVGLVLGERTRRALGGLGVVNLGVHGNVESITTDDLVKMGSVLHAGVHEGISSLNNELRAGESQHLRCETLGGGILREERGGSDVGQLHHLVDENGLILDEDVEGSVFFTTREKKECDKRRLKARQ